MDEMPRMPGLQRRKHGRYYFRMKVPFELRPFFNDRYEIVKSLKTSDHNEASRLVSIERARTETKFAEVRRRLGTNTDQTSTIVDVEQAVWDWFEAQEQREWNAFRKATDDELDTASDNLKNDEAHLTDLKDLQAKAAIVTAARKLVRRYRLRIDEADELFAELCMRVRRAQIEHLRRWEDWLAGDLSRQSHDPAFAAPPVVSPRKLSLNQLIEAFLNDPAHSDRSPKKALEYGLAFAVLREVVGANEAITGITRNQAVSGETNLSL